MREKQGQNSGKSITGGNAGSSAAVKVPTARSAPVTDQRLSSPVTPWMLLDDWPYGGHSDPAVLQATFSTLHLRNRCRNATLTMAAEGSMSGSFTGGAATAEARVGTLGNTAQVDCRVTTG
jgi:hypothetical protein